jgi:hypothetical protein
MEFGVELIKLMLACMFKLHFTSLGCNSQNPAVVYPIIAGEGETRGYQDLLVIIISFFRSSVVFKFTRKSI